MSAEYVLAVDIGTTSAKTCVFKIGKSLKLVSSAQFDYPIRFLPNGGAEQNPDDWWKASCSGARKALAESGIPADAIGGMAFCCQMQSLVLVDKNGSAVRPSMSYMDQRATEEKHRGIERGFAVEGMNVGKLLPSLAISGGVSASVKDPLWKYQWVRAHEPDAFSHAVKWLDVKEYLVGRCTGRFAMTPDSAFATMLFDSRPGKMVWSRKLCDIFDVDIDKMPEVVASTDIVGPLLPAAAEELGLKAGTPVFGGGGDLSLIALGSGAVNVNQAHIYMGTSGWVSACVDRRMVDIDARVASVLGAMPGRFNYMSEQETSGKCMEWVKDHLALDEIGLYLGSHNVCDDPEAKFDSVFDFLAETVKQVKPGSEGIIFAPWFRGSRSPFEDPNVRGVFFNIGIDTGKRCMVRAVVEGLGLQTRWQLEAIQKKVRTAGPIRFVGGGARSMATTKIMADIIGQRVETTESPQNAGALGAAMLCARGLGAVSSFDEAASLVPVVRVDEPDPTVRSVYDEHYEVLKQLYYRNRDLFGRLNRVEAV